MNELLQSFKAFNINGFYSILHFLMNNYGFIFGLIGITGCFIFEELENRNTEIFDERTII